MRTRDLPLVAAAVMTLVAAGLLVSGGETETLYFGWFAATESGEPAFAYVASGRDVAAWVLLWIASLVAVSVLATRLTARRAGA